MELCFKSAPDTHAHAHMDMGPKPLAPRAAGDDGWSIAKLKTHVAPCPWYLLPFLWSDELVLKTHFAPNQTTITQSALMHAQEGPRSRPAGMRRCAPYDSVGIGCAQTNARGQLPAVALARPAIITADPRAPD